MNIIVLYLGGDQENMAQVESALNYEKEILSDCAVLIKDAEKV